MKEKSKVTFDVDSAEEDDEDRKLQSDVKKMDHKADIMAQQYKYIACLKVSLLCTRQTVCESKGLECD